MSFDKFQNSVKPIVIKVGAKVRLVDGVFCSDNLKIRTKRLFAV